MKPLPTNLKLLVICSLKRVIDRALIDTKIYKQYLFYVLMVFNIKEYIKNRYHNDPEFRKKFIASVSKYQSSKKGQKKIKEYRIKCKKNPEARKRRNAYFREKMLDSSFRLKRILYIKLRRRLNSFHKYGRTKPKQIYDDYYKREYGVDFEAIIKKLQPIPKDISNLQIDHIIPLSKFDFTKRGDIKKAYSPKNIRLIPKKENLKKGSKLID